MTGQARSVNRQCLAFRRGQKLADPEHRVAGVGPPLALSPQIELFAEVSGRLAGQRRIGRAKALTVLAMASGTGDQPPRGSAIVIQRKSRGRSGDASLERQPSVIEGHGLALAGVELLRDPAHLLMVPAPVPIGFELPFQISRIESRQARRASAVSPPVETMAGEAGVVRACRGAAERDNSAVFGEPVHRSVLGRGAATHQRGAGKENVDAHGSATVKLSRMFQSLPLAYLLLFSAACKPPPEQRQFMPLADAGRGKAVIERVGCGSCHTIRGVDWPQGKVGPSLDGLAQRALIAGKLPNRPDVLAAYIRNAPAMVPDSGMPAMPVDEAESRDIAAFLYAQGDR